MKKNAKVWVVRIIAIVLALMMVIGSIYAIVYSFLN